MKIFIIGAGEVGFHIASSLAREGHDLVIMDRDGRRARELQSQLDVLVVHADGCDAGMLDQHGISEADIVFTVSNNDAANLLASISARRMGADRCVVRLGQPHYRRNPLLLEDERIIPIHPEQLVAEEMATITRVPGASKARFFEKGRLVMVQVRPAESAAIYGKPLKEVDWPEGWLLAGLRKGNAIRVPHGGSSIRRGETCYVVGPTDGMKRVTDYLGVESGGAKQVVVGGGGHVGSALVRLLIEEGVSVSVIEKSENTALELASRLPRAVVLQGDVSDPGILREAGANEADYFIASTQDDMTNVVSALLAKELGARTVAALYNRMEFLNILRAAHIDMPISPRLVMAGTILRMVHRREILTIDMVADGRAEIVEFEVPKSARVLNQPLKSARFPKGVVVCAVARGEEIHVPSGDFRFQVGDHVLVFALANALENLERMFHER